MWIRTEALHVPKHGNAEDEYEDAFFPESGVSSEVSSFRCAVADGASESAFSGLWARLLVRGFGRGRLRLEQLRRTWQRAVGGRGGGDAAAGNGKAKQLPWYLEKKVASGAHAALIGLALREGGNGAAGAPAGGKKTKKKRRATKPPADGLRPLETPPVAPPRRAAAGDADAAAGSDGPGGSWRALAVGDSCVFQVRGDTLVAVGPLCKAEQFNNSPYLLASKATQHIRRGDEQMTIISGRWQPGDTFLLASDAISQWLLAEHEAGRPPWSMLRALGPQTFARFVEKLRAGGALHNDDTTLMRIEVA